jgi:putative endonuclease
VGIGGMKKFNRETGRRGEEVAREYLEKQGLELVERNWGNKWGEIDLIMKDKGVLVMVEVKAKVGREYGAPWEIVTRRKLAQVKRMGELYLREVGWQERARIDVVGVVFNREIEVEELKWWRNVL